MIILLVVVTAGWVLLSVFGAIRSHENAPLFWTLLSVGTVLLVFILLGVVMYLTLTIKAVNVTRRQSNFIDSVTHELKSPITSLKLYLQTLRCREVGPEQRSRFYQFMLEDIERLDRLINHLLVAGRAGKEPLDHEMEEVELSKLLERCASEVFQRYGLADDRVHFALQPCVVRAPRVDLDMVFRNLIDNAVKYGGCEPQVEIVSRLNADNTVAVDIRDNGLGIPPAQRKKIFGRFVRLGLELTRQKPGTGLGLFIVRTLLRRLHGRICVFDRQPGPGTVFQVVLPAQSDSSHQTSSQDEQAPSQAEVA